MFLLLSCAVEGGSRAASGTKTREVPLQEGVCIFAVAAVVHMFVYIVVSYAEGHRKACVTRDGQGQVHRLPFVSHSHGQNSSPRYKCMRSSLPSHVIMFLLLSCILS